MKHLKTFENFNYVDVNEGVIGDMANKIKGAFKDKTSDKIEMAYAEVQKGILTDDLKNAYKKLKEQDNLFPIGVIAGGGKNPGMAPNVYLAIEKNNKEAIKKITDVEIAKVFLQSKTVEKVGDKWEGTGRGAAQGVTGAQGAYKGLRNK